jgi:hypothetical protein
MGLASGVATFVAVRAKSNHERSKTHARINLRGADRTSGHASPAKALAARTDDQTRRVSQSDSADRAFLQLVPRRGAQKAPEQLLDFESPAEARRPRM